MSSVTVNSNNSFISCASKLIFKRGEWLQNLQIDATASSIKLIGHKKHCKELIDHTFCFIYIKCMEKYSFLIGFKPNPLVYVVQTDEKIQKNVFRR